MHELSTITTASVFNQVYHLQKPDYSRDVTEASSKAYVLVLLTSSHGTNGESRILIEIWRELAKRFGDIKFCQIRADLCIEGYPEKNTPTVLVYKDGDIKKQLVTLRELRGTQTNSKGTPRICSNVHRAPHGGHSRICVHYTCKIFAFLPRHVSSPGMVANLIPGTDVEQLLVDIGAVRIGDTRLQRNKSDEEATSSTSKIRQSNPVADPDDSDWD